MAEDTPAPIATPEEVARKIVRGLPSAWRVGSARREQLLVDGITTAIAAALTSSNAEIEGLRLKLELTTAQRDDARAHGEALTDQVGRLREALAAAVATGFVKEHPLPDHGDGEGRGDYLRHSGGRFNMQEDDIELLISEMNAARVLTEGVKHG